MQKSSVIRAGISTIALVGLLVNLDIPVSGRVALDTTTINGVLVWKML